MHNNYSTRVISTYSNLGFVVSSMIDLDTYFSKKDWRNVLIRSLQNAFYLIYIKAVAVLSTLTHYKGCTFSHDATMQIKNFHSFVSISVHLFIDVLYIFYKKQMAIIVLRLKAANGFCVLMCIADTTHPLRFEPFQSWGYFHTKHKDALYCIVGIHLTAPVEHSQMNTHVPVCETLFGFFASSCIGQISRKQYKG